jgi:hypothetical protein
MPFAAELNKYVIPIWYMMGITLFIGLHLGYRKGGWNRNLVYLWTLIVYTIYLFITPIYYYLTELNIIIGTDITEYYGLGFFFNTIALICFILGYWVKGREAADNWNKEEKFFIAHPKRLIAILFYSFYGIVLLNLAAGGANIQQVFVGNEVLGLGASGGSYFLQNFTDSLICVIILAYFFGIPTRTLLIWIGISFFLFSLLGFRYRILLSLFGILFIYLYKNKVSVRQVLVGGAMGLIFFYGIMFSTENRRALIYRNYEEVVYNPIEFDYANFFAQTRGALPDMAVYKLYDNPNRNAQYDYGLTMFGYVFIRMIPRSIYPDKDKFYPPPQLATTLQAYDAWWAKFSGEATLSVAALYIAFGWLGIVAGHFLWGLLLRRYRDRIRLSDKIQITSYVVVALATFQWITRGYFPQVLDHFVYMMIPIWILRYFAKKNVGFENS